MVTSMLNKVICNLAVNSFIIFKVYIGYTFVVSICIEVFNLYILCCFNIYKRFLEKIQKEQISMIKQIMIVTCVMVVDIMKKHPTDMKKAYM